MSVVIIGGGQSALQVADSLRGNGYTEQITIVADEAGLPYQRPPLSKDFLSPQGTPKPLPLRGENFFSQKSINLLDGVSAIDIDRPNRQVALSNGNSLGYTHLVLATGARNRLIECPGSKLDGVHSLRTLDDVQDLHAALPAAKNVVVVGAGFIGLEFAAAARAHDCHVTVLEFAARPMARALSEPMSQWFAQAHRDLGVELRLNEGIERFEAAGGGEVMAAVSSTGQRYPADLVLVGVGVLPNVALAENAGLETSNGIVVDQCLRTSDPSIFASGDCANFPNVHSPGRTRLESVQNATDQARHLAGSILGDESPYADLPWFWSTQGPYRLQIAGLSQAGDDTLVLGDPRTAKFSVLCFRGEALAAVESVNLPADHLAARKLIGAGTRITRAEAEEAGFALKNRARVIAGAV
ncbi:MAG TPA: pyridine nucleotide-disulfide oxidoreductase [Micrococcaceae bacterium]|nr:pyridine nucleotide-disulfide oxidoreductase [Micrococcaceae bacterium]